MTAVNYFEELTKLMGEYPDLVLNNDGYEEIPQEVRQANIEGHDRVEQLLKASVANFVRFQNFKPRKDGSIAVRCQTRWSEAFTGVSYIPLDDFRPEQKD